MTIRQLEKPCWVLDPRPSGEDSSPHYDTHAEALTVIREAWDRDRDWVFPGWLRARLREVRWLLSRLRPRAPRPRQLDDHCWVVQDDGGCEQVLDEEDEGYVFHHDSRQDAEQTAAAWGWTYSADGRFIYCPCEPREDGEPIPPSPAEQEAAGQLVIPGVLS